MKLSFLLLFCLLLLPGISWHVYANEDEYEVLKDRVFLDSQYADIGIGVSSYFRSKAFDDWIGEMSKRLFNLVPSNSILKNNLTRDLFLKTVYYESVRSGLNPQWVLAVIQVESYFRKHAISVAGARGYMQIMPFWVDLIGDDDDNLFNLRTNVRYGTVILRHYLDMENGNLFRALGRYNGSLGRRNYPNLVINALRKNWLYQV